MKKRKPDCDELITDLQNTKSVPASLFVYFENGDVYKISTKPLLKRLRGKQYTKSNFIEAVSKFAWTDIKPLAVKLAYPPCNLSDNDMWQYSRKSF